MFVIFRFYRPWNNGKSWNYQDEVNRNQETAWEFFRFDLNGGMEVHQFCLDGCKSTSELGSKQFCCKSYTPGTSSKECSACKMFSFFLIWVLVLSIVLKLRTLTIFRRSKKSITFYSNVYKTYGRMRLVC